MKVVGSSPIFFVYLVMLCETVYSLRTLNLPGKLRGTAESKISFGAARRYICRTAGSATIVMYTQTYKVGSEPKVSNAKRSEAKLSNMLCLSNWKAVYITL